MFKQILIGIVIFITLGGLKAGAQITDGIEENESAPADIPKPCAPSFEEACMHSIDSLQKQLEKAPNNESLLSELGKLQVKMKLMEDAFLTYSRLIGVNPKNYDACLFLGHNYYAKGKNLLQYEDKKYKKTEKQGKMQYAVYQNKVKEILGREYKLALQYLSIAMNISTSTFVQNIVEEIHHRMLNPDPFR